MLLVDRLHTIGFPAWSRQVIRCGWPLAGLAGRVTIRELSQVRDFQRGSIQPFNKPSEA